jgi:hypothetical protein
MRKFLAPLLLALAACSSSTDPADAITECAEEACADAPDAKRDACVAEAEMCVSGDGYTPATDCGGANGSDPRVLSECMRKSGALKP